MKIILCTFFAVALVLVLVEAGKFVYFTGTEIFSDNMFISGTMDLYMTNQDVSLSDVPAGSI